MSVIREGHALTERELVPLGARSTGGSSVEDRRKWAQWIERVRGKRRRPTGISVVRRWRSERRGPPSARVAGRRRWEQRRPPDFGARAPFFEGDRPGCFCGGVGVIPRLAWRVIPRPALGAISKFTSGVGVWTPVVLGRQIWRQERCDAGGQQGENGVAAIPCNGRGQEDLG